MATYIVTNAYFVGDEIFEEGKILELNKEDLFGLSNKVELYVEPAEKVSKLSKKDTPAE